MNGNKIKLFSLFLAALMLAGGLVFLVPADESDADGMSPTGYALFGMGSNSSGQQGNPDTTTNVTVPTQIGSFTNITYVASSGYATFFIDSGKLYGMGSNSSGQQGNPDTTTNVTVPTQIGSFTNVTYVAISGSTTLFIDSGKLYGMGADSYGILGQGNSGNITTPTQIGSFTNVTNVFPQAFATLFIDSGKLYGMGANGGSTNGRLGQGNSGNITTPTQIGSFTNVTDIISVSDVSYIIDSGKLYGTGKNTYGQQGNSSTSTVISSFTQIGSFTNVTYVATSGSTTLFIDSGKLYGMGSDNRGCLGQGNSGNITTPTQIGSFTNVTYVATSGSTTFFIDSGKLYGMGSNSSGQQGNPDTTTNVTVPTQIGSFTGVYYAAVPGPDTFFLSVPPAANVTIESNNTSYGTVSNASITDIEPGTAVTISQDGLTLTIGAFGSSVATPATSTAQYTYGFSGWYVDNVALETGDTIDEDVAIEARFTQAVNQYTVTFTAGSGGTVSPASVTVDYGTSISASDNVVTVGTTPVTATPDTSTAQYTYAFDSWTNASGTVTEDRTITANFTTTLNSYTVTWSINGVETAESYDYGELPAHEDPAIEGYTFEGWDPEISTVTGNITYTAILDPIEYTVTFDAQGGTVDPASAVGSIDDPIALPTPTKQFYSFGGWYDAATEGTLVSSPYTPTADITLYAYWSEVEYTITFDANGGTVDTATLTGSPITAVTLPRALQSGFYFAGWYTAASEGELVALAGALMYPTEDVTYYAQYSDAKVYFNGVNFNNNGGYGAPGPLSHTAASKGSYDFTIPETVPTLDGKTFRGWAKTTTESAKYQPGDTISVAADAQVTLYAIWEDQQNTNETLLSLIPLLIVIATVMIAATAAFKFRDGDYMGIIYLVIGIVVIIMLLTMFVIPVINEV